MLLNKNKVEYGSIIIKKIRGSSLIPAKSTGTGPDRNRYRPKLHRNQYRTVSNFRACRTTVCLPLPHTVPPQYRAILLSLRGTVLRGVTVLTVYRQLANSNINITIIDLSAGSTGAIWFLAVQDY